MKFKVGDRIKVTEIIDYSKYGSNGPRVGDTGTVVGFYNENVISIEFNNIIISGHTCRGLAEHHKGWDISKHIYSWKMIGIPNNPLSRLMYPNLVESDCGKYLVRNI